MKVLTGLSLLVFRLKLPSSRCVFYLILFVLINLINFIIFHHRHSAVERLTATISLVNPLNNYDGHAIPKKLLDNLTFQLWLKKMKVSIDTLHVDIHDSNYDFLFAKHTVNSVLKLDLEKRCDAYFTNLYVKSPGWSLGLKNRFRPPPESEETWDDYKNVHWDDAKLFLEKKLEEEAKKKGIQNPKLIPNEAIEEYIRHSFTKIHETKTENELTMLEQLSHIRVFLKCYVGRSTRLNEIADGKFVELQTKYVSSFSKESFTPTNAESNFLSQNIDSCSDLESRVFPWLAHRHPRYQRFSDHEQAVVPKMTEFADKALMKTNNARFMPSKNSIKSKLTGNRACWLNKFHLELNGKGIVVPMNEASVSYTVRLIKVLRALGNKYPIQIVSFGTLSGDAKTTLKDAARNPIYDLPKSYEAIQEHLNYDIFTYDDHGLRQQELWFVDASTAISPDYLSGLAETPLSAFASFANSFQEYILMDPLAIPLKNPKHYFLLPGYKSTGAYFYRSRPLSMKKDEKEIVWFRSMAPSAIDTAVFNIPMMSEKSLSLAYFEGLDQVQDANFVVVNKARHFNTIVLLLQLSFYWPFLQKGNIANEHWLAFALSGDDKYTFNEYMPAALGSDIEADKGLKICSGQVGHIDTSSHHLAWIGGGFSLCPATDIFYDQEMEKAAAWKTFMLPEQMETFYKLRLDIKKAIIPPFEGIQSLSFKEENGEQPRPWKDTGCCKNTIYCAFSEVSGFVGGQQTQRGEVINFDSKDVALYNFYGDVWMDAE